MGKQKQKPQVAVKVERVKKVRLRSRHNIKVRSGLGKAWDFHNTHAMRQVKHPQQQVSRAS